MDSHRLFVCRSRILLSGVVGCLLAAGCSGGSADSSEPQSDNLKAISTLFTFYLAENAGRVPADEAAFKQFIAGLDQEKLSRLNVKDVDAILVSPRDNKPYVVLYAGDKRKANSDVIAYEQTGTDSGRFVVDAFGVVQELDKEGFEQLLPGTP